MRAKRQASDFLTLEKKVIAKGLCTACGTCVGVCPQGLLDIGWIDGDCRWMNRGAYDLMGVNPDATVSRVGFPKAVAIYGALPEQLRDPNSFVSQLKRMLRARKASRIAFSKLVAVPEVVARGVVVMLFQRPEDLGWIVTALNFGREPVHDNIRLPQLAGKSAQLIFSTHSEKAKSVQLSDMGGFPLELEPIQCEVFVVE